MSQGIHYVAELAVKDGQTEAFKEIASELAAKVEQNEPDTVVYKWHLSDDGARCRVDEWFTSSEALLAHFTGEAMTSLLPKVLECAGLEKITVHGDPSPEVRELLGNFPSEIFAPVAGFTR